MMRHVTRVTAFAAGLLLATGAAWAQSSPSHFPAATQPLNGADAVLMDQGSGCASGIQPCATKNSPSTRIGQPVQQTTAPTSPFAYQQWIDTSLSPPQLKMRIGSSWFTVASLSSTIGFGFNVPASAVTGLGTMATQNANAVAITGGSITGMPTPTASSDAATKQYVDGKASGIVFQQGVDYATAAILPNTPVYANGTLGVGRTLTAGSNTTLTVDGAVAVLTKRVLVKNQSDQTQNGCYSVTTAGGGVPWVLTGCTDWDQAAEMQTGSSFIAIAGATNAATSWVLNTTGAVTVGATPLVFVQSAASNIYTAGTGLTLGGAVFSITNTGVAAATYGSATQVGQFAVNAQGQITTASNVAIAIPASSLTNGTTGSGAVMLAVSPTSTGTLTAAAISAGNLNVANTIGGGVGGQLSMTNTSGGATNTNKFLRIGPTGTLEFANSAYSFVRLSLTDAGILTLNAYGAGVLSTDASGNVSSATATTGTGAVMLADSPTSTGTLTAATLSATTLNLGGRLFANTGGVYNVLSDGAGNQAIYLGSGGDPTNYYRNTAHVFGNIGGGTVYATLNGTGVAVGTSAPLGNFDVKAAADQHFLVRGPAFLADGVSLYSVNDANSLLKSMEFGASTFVLNGGAVRLGAYGAGVLTTDVSGNVSATGTTGTGAVMLATSPTSGGTLTAAAISTGAFAIANAVGGNYGGQLSMTNTSGGATNATKYLRISPTGGLEVINSAFSAVRLVLTDAGALQLAAYGAGILATDGSGNVSATATTGTGAVMLAASPTTTGTLTAATITASGNVSAPNYQIASGATTDAGTVGFFTSNGPGWQFFGSASAGAGLAQLITGGSVRMLINSAGALRLVAYGAGILATDGSGNVSATATTGTGAVMLANSPTSTGTLTAATINAVQYNLSGVALANTNGTHNILYDGSSRAAIFLGGTGDPTNYYRNTTHYFQSIGGAATFVTIDAAGLQAGTGTFVNTMSVAGAGACQSGVQVCVGTSGSGITGAAGTLSVMTSNLLRFQATDTSTTTYVNAGFGSQVPTHQVQLSADDGFKPGGGSWGNSSDARLKTNVVADFDAMAQIRLLNPVLFDWKDPALHASKLGVAGKPYTGGFLAQDIRRVFPDFVSEADCQGSDCAAVGGGKVLGMTLPFKFDAYLVRAMQQLDARLTAAGIP